MKKNCLLFVSVFFLIQHTMSQVLPGASSANAITVIAGNSPGSAPDQLYWPTGWRSSYRSVYFQDTKYH